MYSNFDNNCNGWTKDFKSQLDLFWQHRDSFFFIADVILPYFLILMLKYISLEK